MKTKMSKQLGSKGISTIGENFGKLSEYTPPQIDGVEFNIEDIKFSSNILSRMCFAQFETSDVIEEELKKHGFFKQPNCDGFDNKKIIASYP